MADYFDGPNGTFAHYKKGFKYIFVVTDMFTKFPLIFPLRNATTPAVIKHVENDVFLTFGAPVKIICDNGVQFRSKEFKKLALSYDVNIVFNANCHPQSNSTERVNREIFDYAKKSIVLYTDLGQPAIYSQVINLRNV